MNAKLLLIISLVLGGITTFLFFSYMQKQAPQPVMVQENRQAVIVAMNDINENTALTVEMFEELLVPVKQIHPNAMTDLSSIEGMIAISNIAKGETVLTNHVQKIEEEEKFIARKITDGFRAVAIGANFVQTVSNLIEPEDIVDVVSTYVDSNDEIISELIFEKVRVLAVDRRMVEHDGSAEFFEYSSVTVELMPEDAVKVINATAKGTIHFTIHSKVSNEAANN
jgi:pilus assembly protein CpaB